MWLSLNKQSAYISYSTFIYDHITYNAFHFRWQISNILVHRFCIFMTICHYNFCPSMQIAICSNVIYIVIMTTHWHDKYAADGQYDRQSVRVSLIVARWFLRAKLMPMRWALILYFMILAIDTQRLRAVSVHLAVDYFSLTHGYFLLFSLWMATRGTMSCVQWTVQHSSPSDYEVLKKKSSET